MVRIYTRGGDGGETSLVGGGRARKDSMRFEVLGTLDELNALLGVARPLLANGGRVAPALIAIVERVQGELFEMGAELATPDVATREQFQIAAVADERVAALERDVDAFEERLTPLRTFILPGGSTAAGTLHLARAVCRRAERRLVELTGEDGAETNPVALRYLNRLSDLLFVLARAANSEAGVADVPWIARKSGDRAGERMG